MTARCIFLDRAARDLDLDPGRSWLVGDILDDIEAGKRAGCRTVLVDLGTEREPDCDLRRPHFVAPNTLRALRLIRASEGIDDLSPAETGEGVLTTWQ